MAVQRSDLMCSVDAITYNFEKRQGALMMAEHNCCNMTSCIKFFQQIDPGVDRIETFAGYVPDTVYVRTGSGEYEWTALTPSSPS